VGTQVRFAVVALLRVLFAACGDASSGASGGASTWTDLFFKRF
jgi:hypothetical protein